MAYSLYAQFSRSPICRDRQYVALVRWASQIVNEQAPADRPARDWIERRLIAEAVLMDPDYHVIRTIAFALAAPAVQMSIREHLNDRNEDAVETLLDAQLDGAINEYIGRYATAIVEWARVERWDFDHGFEMVE
jgi:hypothetical protein